MHYINVQTHKFNIVKTTAQFTEYFGKDIAKTGEYEVSDDFADISIALRRKCARNHKWKESWNL